jgi:predicted double-glycine peptidase
MLKSAAAALSVFVLWTGPAQAGSVDLPFQVGGAFSVPVTSLKEERLRSTIRQQYDFSCGSAALATLLTHHYGYPTTEEAVFQEMFARGDQQKIRREGFSLLDMKRFLQAHGFEANGFESPLESLRDAGIPGIALINERGYNHFVVVKGIRGGRVLFGDPGGGTRAMPQHDFESLWASRILFVITNRQQAARFNLVADWHASPNSPIDGSVNLQGLTGTALPKFGPSDF